MAGIDAKTGKMIEEPAHIRQSIDKILTTPVGTRVMRREFGVDYISPGGLQSPGIGKIQVEESASRAIATYEPRIRDVDVTATFSGDMLAKVRVTYLEIKSGNAGEVEVIYSRPD